MSHKAYPEYKDSGIEWLGQIPAHWEIRPLKRVAECLDGQRVPVNTEERARMQGEYPYWGANGVLDYVDGWLFDEPLVLLGEDGAPFFEPHKPVSFYVHGKIWVNNHSHVLRPRPGTVPQFLPHVLNTVDYRAFIGGATRDKLTQDDMRGIPIQLPDEKEQQAIAAFLDRETAKIDALVEKKERLIELLQEKRTALITHAVTKGLDPNVPMKDSGIEWLGQIPAHWEAIPVKRLTGLVNGATPRSSEPEYWDGDIAWATPDDLGQLHSRILEDTSRHITEAGYASCGTTLVPPGSLILSTRAPIGHLAIAGREMCMNQGCRGLVPNDDDSSVFRYYSLLAAKPVLQSLGEGSTFQELSRDTLANVVVPNPTLPERERIADFLDRETAKIDALIAKIQEAIERLKEYRTALISAAVTGKIDVREEMA